MPRRTVGLVVILALGLLGLALATAPPPKRVPTIGVLLSSSPGVGEPNGYERPTPFTLAMGPKSYRY